jgi:hypothetical protein
VHKYYVALSARRPSKKMGTVRGVMARSRRGTWKLTRDERRGGGGGGAAAAAETRVRSIHWSPYDPVRVVDADP